MTSDGRVIVRDLLIEAGYSETWATANSAHVSRTYYHHRRPGPKAPKDNTGIAIYGPEDRSGLLDVARELKSGSGGRANSGTAAPCDNPDCHMWREEHGGPCEV
jgi:hypothetical protein